jgi:hypothetical protein
MSLKKHGVGEIIKVDKQKDDDGDEKTENE